MANIDNVIHEISAGAEPVIYKDIDRLEISRDNSGNIILILWRVWVSGPGDCYSGEEIYKRIIIKEVAGASDRQEPEQALAPDAAQQITFDDILHNSEGQ